MDETVIGYHPPTGFFLVTDYEKKSDSEWSINGKEIDGVSSDVEAFLVNCHAENVPEQDAILLWAVEGDDKGEMAVIN